MARVNIEEKVFADPRFRALSIRIGDEEKAMGRLVFVFRMAQEYWANDGKLIPTEMWDIYDYKLLETVGFAERTPDGIYIKGIADRADWLRKKVAAGIKSAEVRKSKYGTAVPKNATNSSVNPNTIRTQSEHPAEPLTLTLTPTLKEIHHTSVSTDLPAAEPKPKKRAEVKSILFDAWNENCGTLAKARGMSAKRRASEAARLKDNPSREYWVEIINRIARSSFCLGKSSSSWRADFDWLLKPDTHLKVLEGKYDDKAKFEVKEYAEGEARVSGGLASEW